MTRRRKVVIVNDTTIANHHGCSAIMTAIFTACEDAGWDISHRHPVAVDWRKDPAALHSIESADLVLVNGEGTIHDDNKSAMTLAAIAPFCEKRRIPAALINASLYRLGKALGDLAAYKKVFVRDQASADLAKRAGISAEVTGDLTFSYDFTGPQAAPESQTICFTDSVSRRITMSLQQDADLLQSDYLPTRPSKFAEDFYAYVNLLAKNGFAVTGRYHAACFCINAGIPFVAVPSNTDKIEALTKDVFGTRRRVKDRHTLHSFRSEAFAFSERYMARQIAQKYRARDLRDRLAPYLQYGSEEILNIQRYKTRTRQAIAGMWRSVFSL